jgi:hypothetical protein
MFAAEVEVLSRVVDTRVWHGVGSARHQRMSDGPERDR